MNEFNTAPSEWNRLNGLRSGMMSRLERLSQLTIPSVLPPDNYNQEQEQLTNGHNSLGAQAATHLVNKIMLAAFAPSRPFMRLDIETREKHQLMEMLKVEEDVITDVLAIGEAEALKELEKAGQRQNLFELITHLTVVGNVLMDLSGDTLNVVPVRDYVVRRNAKGVIVCIILRECYRVDELEDDVRAIYMSKYGDRRDDHPVSVYTWIKRKGQKYYATVWVDDIELPSSFSSNHTEENLPWRPLVWRLPAKQHYGVGRAEDFANDLAEHEVLSRALSEGAVLSSTFKWLANPGGITRPEDVAGGYNGEVIPGTKGDVDLLYANIGQQLNAVQSIRSDVARRIGQGFLMNSAVTRDAERVTAEEIRIQAMELEASLGGNYSRIALDVQQPLSHWLLKRSKVEIKGTKIEPVIITGLDALSRNADRERMMIFLNDVSTLDSIQPATRIKLRERNIIADMAAGAGVERGRYVASEEEIKAAQQQAQAEQTNQLAEAAAMDAAATNATKEVPQ